MPVQSFNPSNDDFTRYVQRGPVIVKYYSPRCGHCITSAPHYESFSNANPQITCLKIDGSQHGEFCRKQGVKGFPTFRVYRKGQVSPAFEQVGAAGTMDGNMRMLKGLADKVR